MVAEQYSRGQGVGRNWNTGHNLHEIPGIKMSLTIIITL